MSTYNPKLVSVVVGTTTITGFSEKDIVSCERNSDRVTPHIGAKGEVSFTENCDNTGKITITLTQDSPSNAILSAYARSRKQFPISVSDSNDGSFRAGGNRARIQKEPANERGAEVADRKWEIYVADYDCVES